ncbi:Hypothetical predicted protein [Cloeon dipterum]|uniref:Uncharacterized protein n=1 Tax=Cloeon dipterum TaxID=197152 RepID=A0A8S1D7W6_9INSE|nr:Hypothetical predicted protein [Cloeon dipterum]
MLDAKIAGAGCWTACRVRSAGIWRRGGGGQLLSLQRRRQRSRRPPPAPPHRPRPSSPCAFIYAALKRHSRFLTAAPEKGKPIIDTMADDNTAETVESHMGIIGRRVSIAGVDEIKHTVSTDGSGPLDVYVQGDLHQMEKKALFLTVHDLGTNHSSFHDFVNHPCMCEIKERSVFIHVDVPGQEDNAPDLSKDFSFPTMATLGEDLVTVLDYLHIKYVIGLGEGAGANALARFAIAHSSRCLGLILINCTGSAASVMDHFKDKFMNWKSSQVSQSAEDYLVFHKFGHVLEQLDNSTESDKDKVIQEYQNRLRQSINPKNLKLYVNSFLNRKDMPAKNIKADVLLVTGERGSFAAAVEKLHMMLDKSKATLLKIDRVGDVMLEAPEKLAQSILLFCKGQGLLTSITMPGVERQRTFSGSSADGEGRSRRLSRGMSMEEYDKPNIRRLSITTPGPLPQLPKSD